MSVRRAAALAVMLFLGATCLRAAPVEADPHALYASALSHMAKGNLQGAEAALARLHALIASGPDWDPQMVFANELLPPLEARLGRLQYVARRLDEFALRAVTELHSPNPLKDTSTVRSYTDWATAVIQRLRGERDDMVSAALADPEERSLLARTESYARTERLLDIDLLNKMAETAGDDVLGLVAEDQKLDSVLLRFRQLKLDLMQATAERDGLKGQIAKSDEHREALLRTLAAVVTDGASPAIAPGDGAPVDVAGEFDRFLDARIAALRGKPSLSLVERSVFLSDVERYKRCKQEFATAGIVLDPADRVETLAQTAESLPLSDGVSAAPAVRGPPSLLSTGAVALAAGLLGLLVGARGRGRLATKRSPMDRGPRLPAKDHRADAGRDAA